MKGLFHCSYLSCDNSQIPFMVTYIVDGRYCLINHIVGTTKCGPMLPWHLLQAGNDISIFGASWEFQSTIISRWMVKLVSHWASQDTDCTPKGHHVRHSLVDIVWSIILKEAKCGPTLPWHLLQTGDAISIFDASWEFQSTIMCWTQLLPHFIRLPPSCTADT